MNGSLFARVDERILVVVEQPEVLVEPHVDARRLDHPEVERIEADAAGFELFPDVAVTQKHGDDTTRVSAPGWGRDGATSLTIVGHDALCIASAHPSGCVK
jgi:hypothetical protein